VTQTERWDCVFEILRGPMAGSGQHTLRGPIIRLGSNPGPGGLRLVGYRGLDARQCVVSAYSGGSASVAPVGTNQVRVAPHPNVKWKEMDPITGPVFLNEGCAIHLGPVGRGATLRFVECRRLGGWEQGSLVSHGVGSTPSVEAVRAAPSGAPPAAIDAASVGQIRTTTIPAWFIGCLFLLASGTMTSFLAIGALLWFQQDVTAIGPIVDVEDIGDAVDPFDNNYNEDLYSDVEKPFWTFVMEPNIRVSKRSELTAVSEWDTVFYKQTSKMLEKKAENWSIYRTLDRVRGDYATVVMAMRKANLPEVFAGIPYQESWYNTIPYASPVCAAGYWHFMPETVVQVREHRGVDMELRGCTLKGRPEKWTPSSPYVPSGIARKGHLYTQNNKCLISSCDVDDREDVHKGTLGAIAFLREPWEDPLIRASGSAVQISILSVNTGYDDARYGPKKRDNVLPRYQQWNEAKPGQGQVFYGENITTSNWDPKNPSQPRNGSLFSAQAQHYAYQVVATHFLAVCYYATNYGNEPAFAPWKRYLRKDGYCRNIDVPMAEEVNKRRSR